MKLNPKKLLLLILSIHCLGYSFSQPVLSGRLFPQQGKIKTVISYMDSVPAKFPGLISTYEKNILHSLKQHLKMTLFDSAAYYKNFFLGAAKNIYQQPFKILNTDIDYSGITDSSYLYNNEQYYSGNLHVQSNWLVAGIPVSFSYQNQTWSDIAYGGYTDRFYLQFERDNYIDQLKKKLDGKFDPTVLLQKLTDPLLAIKQNAEQLLKNDLNKINEEYKEHLASAIQKIGNPQDLFTKDISSIRRQLMNTDLARSIKEKEILYTQLLQKKNLGEAVNPDELKALENSLTEAKGIESLINKIEEHKNKWESSGLIAKMKEWDLLQKVKLQQIMKDPSTTIKLAKQYLSLNGIQKLFLKINKLNIGQNVFSAGSLSLNHFLNNGVVTEFLNNKHYLMLLAGKQQDFNSLLDVPFVNNIVSNTGAAKAISLGSGTNSSDHSHFTIATYNQTLSSSNLPIALATFRRSIVTTISKEILIGEKGSITTEISRSAMDYISARPDTGNKSSLRNLFSADDFWKNTAFSLKYIDEYNKAGLSYQVSVSKTANGYNNPGNLFLNPGSKNLGFMIKKSMWKKKLQLNARIDLREFKYNDERPDKWRNVYAVFDARLRMKKGQYMALRYMPSKMVRIDSTKFTVSAFNRLSAEANLAKKISGYYYRNYLTLSFQKNAYTFSREWISAKTILLSSYQTITSGKKMFYLNTNYNYADNKSQYVYFNSSLLAEAGTSYRLFKKINASSALSYNSISGWYRQVGIRQTLSTNFSERFNLDVYVDARKNIKLYQPLLFGLFRADISIHYFLKNK